MSMGDIVGGLFEDKGEVAEARDEAENISANLLASLSKPTALSRLSSYHATELREMCPTKAMLIRKFSDWGAVWARHNDPRWQITFDIGHALHAWAQSGYLNRIQGYEKDRSFEELAVRYSFESGIKVAGSVDDFLRNKATGEILGVEIKTINVQSFEKMRVAKIAHRYQVYYYLWMLQEGEIRADGRMAKCGWGVEDIARVRRFVVMYFPKEFVRDGTPAVKTFLVDPVNNEKHRKEYETAIKAAKIKMESIVEYVNKRRHLPAEVCESELDAKAVSCLFNPVCFPEDPVPVEDRIKGLFDYWQGRTIASTGDETCPFLDWIYP